MSAALSPPKVFVSYSHDSPEHKERVWRLCQRLRREGVDCRLDQYEASPAEGWPEWTMRQIDEADFVLVVCTEKYYRRVRGRADEGAGTGARWEGAVITQELYEAGNRNSKFIPVLFSADDADYVPPPLRGVTRYELEPPGGYEDLYRRLTNQHGVPRAELGKLRPMPPRVRSTSFPDDPPDGEGPRVASPAPGTRWHALGAWVFGSLLLAFFVGVFVFAPDSLPPFKQRMVGFASAILAGLFAFFMTGRLGVRLTEAELGRVWLALNAAGGLIAFALTLWWWSSPFAPIPVQPYSLLVEVLAPGGAPVADVEVMTSVPGRFEKVGDAWRVSIPAASADDGQEITVGARAAGFFPEQTSARLRDDAEVPVTLRLKKDTSARIKGYVRYPSGEPAEGARVHVTNHDDEAVVTDRLGRFELPAHAAVGDDIQLLAVKGRYRLRAWFTAGGETPVEVILIEKGKP